MEKFGTRLKAAILRYRCDDCHKFVPVAKTAVVKCNGCQRTAYRCDDCGGVNGARKTIYLHRAYYTRVDKAGATEQHFDREPLKKDLRNLITWFQASARKMTRKAA